MFNKAKTFILESKKEFDRVDWPSQEETLKYTLFVLLITLIVAIFLGSLDYLFVNLIELIL